ncbi:hypothetical protein Goari_005415 [Gossypium aridum]|uniref:Transmembrane protein n=1 Tax=Gossypium aridum TaxID=34290 RepID=A0A7J8Y6I0_GOSAI|nr:hypothetical protein [Gossypium aridum]
MVFLPYLGVPEFKYCWWLVSSKLLSFSLMFFVFDSCFQCFLAIFCGKNCLLVSTVLTIFFDLASSDRISTSLVGSNTVEKPTTVSVGSTDQTNNPQVHHQITITTGNIKAPPDSRFSLLRRNNSRRSSSPWVLDPKRILFLFATLSSMGTILLIYFTLSIGKTDGDENAFD